CARSLGDYFDYW
nr:immunoglobulin heavy chain junction region [Mus musculus]MBK4186074.1 immunoglobulin heavy chain junction region [Mus musculus]MBK4186075.1 immunoglobulin heavy chain junction region [Mus musculus]MBK4186076.1 immunoglobulin heavy chain junction region [Mus musculus]MBK4186077.1 immunoglobulin heavy chain junction region [Mus musculus]